MQVVYKDLVDKLNLEQAGTTHGRLLNSQNCGFHLVAALTLAASNVHSAQRACASGALLGRLVGAGLVEAHLLISLDYMLYGLPQASAMRSRDYALLVTKALLVNTSFLMAALLTAAWPLAKFLHAASDGLFGVRQGLATLEEQQQLDLAVLATIRRERAQACLAGAGCS